VSTNLSIEELLAANRAWASSKTNADAGFFNRLVAQQAPDFFWIGCSDSRVPANEIVGLDPGEMFVHRNVANLTPPQDANFLSTLQYAVQILKVKHVLVVGHYGCGGVRAAMERPNHGLIDHWLAPIRELHAEHREEFEHLGPSDAHDRLCELNVIRQVRHVATNPFVTEAWANRQPVSIHGWCYSLATGLVNDLGVSVSAPAEVEELFEGDC
jgi:carbonic anhydrase